MTTDNPTLLPERIYIDADYDPVEGHGHGGFFIKPFATGKSAEYVRAPVVAPQGDAALIVDLQRELAYFFGQYHGSLNHREDVLRCTENGCVRIRQLLHASSPASSVPPEQEDGWVTFGRVKVDIENETETFERIYPPAATPTPVEQDHQCPNDGESMSFHQSFYRRCDNCGYQEGVASAGTTPVDGKQACENCGGSGEIEIGCATDRALTAPCVECGGSGKPLRTPPPAVTSDTKIDLDPLEFWCDLAEVLGHPRPEKVNPVSLIAEIGERLAPAVTPAQTLAEVIKAAIDTCDDVTRLGYFAKGVDPVGWVRDLQTDLERGVTELPAVTEAGEQGRVVCDVEQWKRDLRAAGWSEESATAWYSPDGGVGGLNLLAELRELNPDRYDREVRAAAPALPSPGEPPFVVHEPTSVVYCNDPRCPVGATIEGWPHLFNAEECIYHSTVAALRTSVEGESE